MVLPGQPSFVGKTHIPTISNNHMVQYADPQQLAGRGESIGQSPIFRTWSGITAGMIVKKNDGGG